LAARRFSFREVLVQQEPVPLICAKRAGFRYNRRDIQFDERFEAVDSNDARVLIQAKLARPLPPPEPAARARAATVEAGDIRSRTAEPDAGIPAPAASVELAPKNVASYDAPPELGGPPPKKKRVRNHKVKAPGPAPQP
jgi:hypothetical protein